MNMTIQHSVASPRERTAFFFKYVNMKRDIQQYTILIHKRLHIKVCDQYQKCASYTKVKNDPKGQMMAWFYRSGVCVCLCAYTSPPRVNSGVVLIVEVWLIQVAKGFKLQLSILEEVQLGEKGQTHKPELEHTHKQTSLCFQNV